MPRIFTGLEIPADIGRELSMLRGGLPGARWIDPENYHVTLRFVGDVDHVVAHEVASLLGMVRRTEFELRFDALSSFGGRRPRSGRELGADPGIDGFAGRARTPDAPRRPRCGRAQVHAPCHAGAAARILQPAGRRLSFEPRSIRAAAIQGVALRLVLLAGFGRGGPYVIEAAYPLAA
jgi:hypothetical protein